MTELPKPSVSIQTDYLGRERVLHNGEDERHRFRVKSTLSGTENVLSDDLHHLAKVSFALTAAWKEQRPTTDRGYQGENLFRVVARFTDAIAHYVGAFTSLAAVPTEPLATLVRGLLESADVFHYHYLDPTGNEESELRLAVRDFHHEKEERDFRSDLDLPHGAAWTSAGQLAGWMGGNRIERSARYPQFTPAQQADLRSGRRARSGLLPARGGPFGLSESQLRAIYKLLSNFAHSTAWGTRGASLHSTELESTESAILVARHVSAWTIDHYCKRRVKMARLLPYEDRVRVRSMHKHDLQAALVKTWTNRNRRSV